jgi:hypothetical protein
MTHPPINSWLRTQIISIPIESIRPSQSQGRKVEAGAQDSDGEAASSRKRGPQWRCTVESRVRAWGSDGEAASSHKLGPWQRVAMESKAGPRGSDGEAALSHECRPWQRGGFDLQTQALCGSSLSAELPRPRSWRRCGGRRSWLRRPFIIRLANQNLIWFWRAEPASSLKSWRPPSLESQW